MTFTGNEMHPKTDFQLAIGSLFIFMAYITNAYLFSEMAVMVRAINSKWNKHSRELDKSNKAMENIKMPLDLK
jgi:hypothetical protein